MMGAGWVPASCRCCWRTTRDGGVRVGIMLTSQTRDDDFALLNYLKSGSTKHAQRSRSLRSTFWAAPMHRDGLRTDGGLEQSSHHQAHRQGLASSKSAAAPSRQAPGASGLSASLHVLVGGNATRHRFFAPPPPVGSRRGRRVMDSCDAAQSTRKGASAGAANPRITTLVLTFESSRSSTHHRNRVCASPGSAIPTQGPARAHSSSATPAASSRASAAAFVGYCPPIPASHDPRARPSSKDGPSRVRGRPGPAHDGAYAAGSS